LEGDEMAIINPEIAKKIATELYNYVDFLKPGDPSIDEVYDDIYIDIRKPNLFFKFFYYNFSLKHYIITKNRDLWM
jgi:hypothetical protein